ncbi:acyl transferase/acyl hydrolase/lysophospholipase [Xylariaceae sp. FL0804]|nr:acyl transferase/acyl hydrolase/lysophospholipase [Xylariaceae sp. FL0804]
MEALGLPLRQSTLDSQATDETDDVFEDAQEAFSESPVENPAAYKHGDVPSIQGGRADGIASSDYSDAERGNYHTAASLAIPQQTVTLNLDPEAAGPSHSQHAASHAKPCDICEDQGNEVWFCNVCTIIFCQRCWDAQALHRLSRPGPKHEKTSPEVAAKVQNVLSPPVDERVRERLYRSDAPTAWFGVDRPDDLGPPVFQDYGRFTDLMIATDPVRSRPSFFEQWADVGRDRRTPSLVSFVGQTGAGKSTLVKLLIDFAMTRQDNYSTPVIGPRGAHIPTSEDVHLYLDPRTADSKGPLLYADCEGLEGGEREPLGAMFKRKLKQETSRDPGIENNISKANVISERELQWANAPRARSREFAVTNLYPRLLYTFSDVIVFVLRNPRVIEHVFERLVKWAAAAIETSSNQPVLPHAIIALNASEHDLDDSLWDVKHNTETILEDLAYTVNRNETFKKGAQFWRERGKVIDNLLDLVLCYYSSIQVIRLPADGRPKLMGDQIGKLYHATLTACIAARCVRYEARMLLDVEDQQAYLQEAFSHYSNTLESPFDFVQASFRNSPIPPDFGGNILKLALSMMNILGSEQHIDAKGIFSELSWMVASCIMLDSARNKNKGSASQIFPKYINHLDDALENFCDQHWPCEFVNPKTGVRCVNVRSGHTAKGHQSADGKVFAAGEWKSTFSFNDNANRFRNWVYYCLVELLRELTTRVQDGGEVEDLVASDIHKTMVLRNLFSHAKHSDMGAKEDNYLVSHTACFCCLFGQAEHVLPCGHVLCTACVSAYGHPRGANGFAILECPFEGPMNKRQSSWIVHLKPKSAGVRVVTLDGGGIRGIVELEALRQIEIALGGVPIRCFVDLLVGTSTGGLVALGLGTMEWTVDECIGHFEALCHEAFTRRVGSTLPLLGSLVENYHHSKYQTTTLEKAYTSAFTDDTYLFGGRRPFGSSGSLVKVAVTATSLAGNRTYIFSNYNRPRDSHKTNQYHFQRPELLGAEVKVWEAYVYPNLPKL